MASEAETSSFLLAAECRLLWAKSKPRHPLWKRLLDVAAASLELPAPSTANWGPSEVALVVGLHDIGKADSVFQHQVPDPKEEHVEDDSLVGVDAQCRHKWISAHIFGERLAEIRRGCLRPDVVRGEMWWMGVR